MAGHRRLDVEEAYVAAFSVAESWHLTPVFSQKSGDGLAVTLCHLLEGGAAVAGGMGKGQGRRAKAGALCEALERLVMARPTGAHYRRPIEALAAQPGLTNDDLVHRVAATHPAALCLVRPYAGPDGEIEYPAGLLNPIVGQQESSEAAWAADYLRYSSSVGMATGSDHIEATLHGLFELIEHDSVSLALLGWFIAGDEPVRIIDIRTAPAQVEARQRQLCDLTGRDVILVDVTTDVGVPTFMAIMDAVADGAGVAGGGASLSPVEAMSSALDEVEQLWAFHGRTAGDSMPETLAPWPALYRCQRLAVDELRDRSVESAWPATVEFKPRDVDEALRHVTRALQNVEVSYFTSSLTETRQSGLAVVSTVAPGLERFSIVRHGHPVVPTGRGRQIWERATARRTTN